MAAQSTDGETKTLVVSTKGFNSFECIFVALLIVGDRGKCLVGLLGLCFDLAEMPG